MDQTITLTESETAIINSALHLWAENMDDLGAKLIEHTNSRQAGFNCYDEAQEGIALARRLRGPYAEPE